MHRRWVLVAALGLLGGIACSSVPPLADTSASSEALAAGVLDALTRGDRARLDAIALERAGVPGPCVAGPPGRAARAESAVLVRVGRPSPEEQPESCADAHGPARQAPHAAARDVCRDDEVRELRGPSRRDVRGCRPVWCVNRRYASAARSSRRTAGGRSSATSSTTTEDLTSSYSTSSRSRSDPGPVWLRGRRRS